LNIDLADDLADWVPATFWQYLGNACALVDLELTIRSGAADPHGGLATPNVSHVITGLAGLSRLRTLTLSVEDYGEAATLPACVSRLIQLTFLCLKGLSGLRCAPGWARLPALECLKFRDCEFARDGEDAMPGMDALASLTEFEVLDCPWPARAPRIPVAADAAARPRRLALRRCSTGSVPARQRPLLRVSD